MLEVLYISNYVIHYNSTIISAEGYDFILFTFLHFRATGQCFMSAGAIRTASNGC